MGKVILNLNGLRCILATLVVYAHVTQNQITGKYAVSTFFVLSGFLMGLKYSSRDSKFGFKKILTSMFKLYPGHLLMLILFSAIAIRVLHKDLFDVGVSFIAHALFVQSWMPTSWIELLNSPTWFLATYFGILYMFCLYKRTTVVLIVDALLCGVVLLTHEVIDEYWWYYASPYMRFFDFIIAYYLGKFTLSQNEKISIKAGWGLWGVLLVIIFLTVFVRVRYWDMMPESIRYSLIYLPSSLLIVYTLYRSEKCSMLPCRVLQSKILQVLGGGGKPSDVSIPLVLCENGLLFIQGCPSSDYVSNSVCIDNMYSCVNEKIF